MKVYLCRICTQKSFLEQNYHKSPYTSQSPLVYVSKLLLFYFQNIPGLILGFYLFIYLAIWDHDWYVVDINKEGSTHAIQSVSGVASFIIIGVQL